MKNTKLQLKIGTLAVIAGLYSAGAVAETATGIASATVVTPLAIGTITNMSFGTIASGSIGGTIQMAAGGGLTTTGDADIVGAPAGQSLTFPITGETGYAYTVTADNAAADGNIILSNGTQTMVLSSLAVSGDNGLSGGSDTIEVVGILTLGGSQASGSYSTANSGGTPIVITANYD